MPVALLTSRWQSLQFLCRALAWYSSFCFLIELMFSFLSPWLAIRPSQTSLTDCQNAPTLISAMVVPLCGVKCSLIRLFQRKDTLYQLFWINDLTFWKDLKNIRMKYLLSSSAANPGGENRSQLRSLMTNFTIQRFEEGLYLHDKFTKPYSYTGCYFPNEARRSIEFVRLWWLRSIQVWWYSTSLLRTVPIEPI